MEGYQDHIIVYMYLQRAEIQSLIKSNELIIRPLLEDSQVGEVTVDFRLGNNFLVFVQGREPAIDTTGGGQNLKSLNKLLQETRRRFGESFILHPGQTVLGTSLEYVKLPNNVFITLNMRSTYARLGLTISTIVQPGYCGCISLELTNTNNNHIKLNVGARIFQARFFKLDKESNYFQKERKYICSVRPEVPVIDSDKDLSLLDNIAKSYK